MDAKTAEMRFREADSLYRDGQYDEALDRLIELDETFPNTPNVLFPLARCLRRLGRNEEALAICDELVVRCGDLRAVQLRDFIRTHGAPTDPTPVPAPAQSLEGLDQFAHAGALDDLLAPVVPPVPAAQEDRRGKWVAIAIAVAVLVILIGAAFVLIGGGDTPTPESMPEPADAGINLVQAYGFMMVVQVLAMTAALFFTLHLRQKLPYDGALDNLINTVFMSVALVLLINLLPCIGFIIAIVVLYKYYEMGALELLMTFGFFFAVTFLGAVPIFYLAAAAA